jgi:hypothetical protein
MSSESFEFVLKAAQLVGSLTPAWKKFIKTKFFVAILRSPDDDPKNFLLSLSRHPVDEKPVVIISEVRDRIDQHQGDGVVAVTGADIVRRLGEQGGILVELSDGVFNVSRKRVAWLRSGIAATEARVATRKVLIAAAPAAPLPVLSVQGGLVVSSAAPPPPAPERKRRSLEALAALHQPKPAPPSAPAFGSAAVGGQGAAALGVDRLRALAGSMPAMLAVIVVAIGIALFLLLGEDAAPTAEPAIQQASASGAPPPGGTPAPMPAAAQAGAGMVFSPADKSFSVNVPGMPEEIELTPDQVGQMGDLRMHQYKLVTDTHIYTMQATDYGSRLPENIGAAMDGMQASIVGTDGTLVKAAPVALRGGSGREVRVQLGNGAVRAARFAFVGSKFCMVAVVAANGKQSAAEIDAFLNSFQLH